MDDKLTSELKSWLSAEEKDVAAGALLLLRLNRNRILYQNIMRQPAKLLPKLEYELKKHLQIRLDGYTMREVVVMQEQLLPAVKQTLAAVATIQSDTDGPAPEFSGLRTDHDQLPADIQQIPEANKEIFFKMKQVYNTLLTMLALIISQRTSISILSMILSVRSTSSDTMFRPFIIISKSLQESL